MKARILGFVTTGPALFATLLFGSHGSAEVYVAESMRQAIIDDQFNIDPATSLEWPLSLARKDVAEVSITLPEDGVAGIGAYVCPLTEYRKRQQGQSSRNCNGIQRGEYELAFAYSAPYSGEYVLVVDNSHSVFSSKVAHVQVTTTERVSEDDRKAMHDGISDMMKGLHEEFVFEDFDVHVTPCGQENAFSSGADGDITLCSELIFALSDEGEEGAFAGVLLHELGHTLLNLWGQPNWDNEETADTFSAVMMMMSGEREMLEQYIAFWEQRDSVAEALHALVEDSPHPLSVQRARNVAKISDNPDDYVRRWRNVFYQHATDALLQSEIDEPEEYSDSRLAASILRSRKSVVEPSNAAFVPSERYAATTCRAEIGPDKAKRLVERCIAVSPATHPPCNAENTCELIQSEIDRACGMPGQMKATHLECRGW